MRFIATQKAEQNLRSLDPWSLVHFSTGLAFGLLGISLRTTVAAGALYEVAEQVFERTPTGRRFFNTTEPEIPTNVALDMVALVAGHWMAEKWNAS